MVRGVGYARGCYEAVERARPPGDALRLCDSALMHRDMPDSDRAATYVNRGIAHMQARDATAALADYEAAIRTSPDVAEAYLNKGIALLNIGNRDEEAVVALTQALALNPIRPAIAFYSRAVANEQLGRTRAAYEDYGRAAELAPGWADPVEQLQRFRVIRGKTASG
jgi:tetratricopeptide (TPR) repeat protein